MPRRATTSADPSSLGAQPRTRDRVCLFFFFQAEDGIRDYKVTGVQTCALPISLSPGEIAAPLRGVLSRQKNTRVLLGEAVDADPQARHVVLRDGATFAYDSLIEIGRASCRERV